MVSMRCGLFPLPVYGERVANRRSVAKTVSRVSGRFNDLCIWRIPLTRHAFAVLRRVDPSPQAGRGNDRRAGRVLAKQIVLIYFFSAFTGSFTASNVANSTL